MTDGWESRKMAMEHAYEIQRSLCHGNMLYTMYDIDAEKIYTDEGTRWQIVILPKASDDA